MAKAEPTTAWGKHVRAWMVAHPGVAYKDALKQAKDSYEATKPAKPVKVKAMKVKAPKPVKERAPSPWIEHVKLYKVENPELKYGEAMREAKATYGVAKVAPNVNIVVVEKKQPPEKQEKVAVEQSGRGKVREPDLKKLHEEIGRIELEYSSVAKRHLDNERDGKIREVMKEHDEDEHGTPAAPEEIAHYESKKKKPAPVETVDVPVETVNECVDVPVVIVRPAPKRKYAKCACGRRVCGCASIDICC